MDRAALSEVERFLHESIPLTRAMGVGVAGMDDRGLMLTAPLELNHNHLGTAFGGSLSALLTVAGYALLWLRLEDSEAHFVVRSSCVKYRRPVRKSFCAIARHPISADFDKFRERFVETGKAAICLQAEVQENGEVCVEFEGWFVALR